MAASLTPSDGATASAARRNATWEAASEPNSTPARLMLGAASLSTPSHLPPIAGSKFWKPVTLPPGRARPATKPLPTGSEICVNTIGMVLVSRRTSANAGLDETTITSGAERTSSAAAALPPSGSAAPQ